MLIATRFAAAQRLFFAAALVVGACKSAPEPPTPQPAPGNPTPPVASPVVTPVVTATTPLRPDLSCDPLATIGGPGDSLQLVVTARLQPPPSRMTQNAADRFIFAHAYETLVNVDCRGRVIPALAAKWSLANGESTTLWLRPDARFWFGDRVRAKDVLDAWKASGDSLAKALAETAVAVGDSALTIRAVNFDTRLLASSRLVVSRGLASATWPEGTGTHRVIQRGTVRLDPVSPASAATFVIRVASLAAARNLIDDGADLLLTGDSATAAYAARRMSAPVVPLEWDRTIVLAKAQRSPEFDDLRVLRLRSDLADDVLRANARSARTPEWFTDPPSCFRRTRWPGRAFPVGRVMYETDDPAAKIIAERFVAINSLPLIDPASLRLFERSELTATVLAVDSDQFIDGAQIGGDRAIVASIPFHAARGCDDVIALVDTRWQAVFGQRVKRVP